MNTATDTSPSPQALGSNCDEFVRRMLRSPQCLAVLNAQGMLRQVNDAGRKSLGISDARPLTGTHWAEFWQGPERTAAQMAVDRARSGEIGRFEGTLETAGGTVHWWDVVVTPLPGADGKPEKLLCISRDVTERRHADEELRNARQRMDAVLIAGEVGTWTYEVQPNRVTADKNLAALFGVTPAQAEGGRIEDYLRAVHPDDIPRIAEVIADAVEKGTAYEAEYRVQQPDGSSRYVVVRGTVERDASGEPVRLPGVVLDVTDRVQAESARQRLAGELERQARIVETVMSGITDFAYTFNREGRFEYANKALLDLWGLELKDAVGKNFFDLKYPDELAARLQRQIQQVFQTAQPLSDETPYTSPTGAGGFYEYILTPVLATDGTVELVAGSTRDITERKRVEDELRQSEATFRQLAEERDALLASERAARSSAEHASRMKDEFLATLSHELRTPLNAILGWAQLMRRGLGGDDLEQGLETIERNARVQTQLIEDLLDMSRIISGKLRLSVQSAQPATFIDAAIETVMPAASAKGIRVERLLDTHAGPVWGDAGRLQQVMWNLLSNAIKFTPKGGRVQVLLERVDSHVQISVADTGQGITAEFLPHVFDRFRQEDASTSRRHSGLGLGLAIVKQLIELHGGSARASSAGENKGSTFAITLPLQVTQAPAGDDPRRQAPEPAAHSAVFRAANLGGVRILVVDDEPDARQLLERVLEECHAQVTTAGSASEALKLLQAQPPDVLVSDVGMPEVDGYELLRRVRALSPLEGGKTPAIALTAFARSEDRTRALLSGYLAHLAKPVDASELVATIAAVAGRVGMG